MSRQLLRVICASLVAALGLAAVAFAGGPAASGVPVAFTIPPGQCEQLPDDLTIWGEGMAYVSLDGKGILHSTVRGTATDSDGGSYRFNYTNQNDGYFSYTGPFPVEITMTDHFNLIGNRGANNIHAHFVWKLVADEPFPGDVTDIFFHGQGGSFEGCDPI